MDPDPDPDPTIFIIDLQEDNKKLIFLKVEAVQADCILLKEVAKQIDSIQKKSTHYNQ